MTSDTQVLHRAAMDAADQAFAACRQGDQPAAQAHLVRAYQLEAQAAEHLRADLVGTEPTRSVLLRSAATLALDCGRWRDAERLICRGLAGDPPLAIAAELRTLMQTVLARALDAREREEVAAEVPRRT
jgi:hypothetical protein